MWQEKNPVLFVFRDPLLPWGPVSCLSSLWHCWALSRVSLQACRCCAVCGRRAGTPWPLLPAQPSVARQCPHPSRSVRTAALPPRRHRPRCPAVGFVTFPAVCAGTDEPRDCHGTFPRGVTGVSWVWRWVRGSASGWAEEWTKCWHLFGSDSLNAWQDRFLEEPHLTRVTFTFFTFVMYVFIRSYACWYLLLKGSVWCFAVELVFGFFQVTMGPRSWRPLGSQWLPYTLTYCERIILLPNKSASEHADVWHNVN